jgi:hypothetical protein
MASGKDKRMFVMDLTEMIEKINVFSKVSIIVYICVITASNLCCLHQKMVVSLNYRSIPKKRVHTTYLMNILGDSHAFGFQ